VVNPLIPEGFGLEDDPEVYAAVKELALHSVHVAMDILDEAAPQQQLQMIRILMPRLMGTLSKGGEDDNEELRKRLNEMYAEVRAALPGGDE
jgi:hypothetical protein